MTLIHNLETFTKQAFGDYRKPTFEEFVQTCRLTYRKDRILLSDFCKELKDGDYRKDKFPEYARMLYDFYIRDFELLVKKWYEETISVDKKRVGDPLRFKVATIPENEIIEGFSIDGKQGSHTGRVLKNIFFEDIFINTKKINSYDKATMLTIFRDMLKCEANITIVVLESSIRFYKNRDYDMYFALLRGVSTKASIFPPYVYATLLNSVFPRGKKVFSPVLSWGSPVLGFANSQYEELVGVDVIPHVVDKCRELHSESETQRNPFFDDPKTATFYCCPSEKLDERHDFSNRYKEYFDLVYSSPPYYDLELYVGGEQSWEQYKTYDEWLEKYWQRTVETCYNVLKVGGIFSFAIVPEYKRGKDTIQISNDLATIAAKYFRKEKLINIQWSGFYSEADNVCEKRTNVSDDLHIFVK